MNNKENLIYTILNIVLEETSHTFLPITKEEIIAKNGNENVRMARCIFVTMLKFFEYTPDTIEALLQRSGQAITDILCKAHDYRKTSWTYRKAEAKCTLRCEEIKNSMDF